MSVASVLSAETETVEEEDIEPASFWRILKLNRTEWPYFVWGSLGALFNGLFPMVLALLLGEVLQVSSEFFLRVFFSIMNAGQMNRS